MHIILSIILPSFLLFTINAQEEIKVNWTSMPVECQRQIIAQCDDYISTYKTLTQLLPRQLYNKRDHIRAIDIEAYDVAEIALEGNTCVYQREIDFIKNEKRKQVIQFSALPTKVEASESEMPAKAFVSLEDGTLCRVNIKKQLSQFTKKAHADAIVDMQLFDNSIITASRDGFVRIWDHELNQQREINFRELIQANPTYIHYMPKQNLILIESDMHDYVYFDNQFNKVDHIQSIAMQKGDISQEHIITASPALIHEMTKLQKGVSFGEYCLLTQFTQALALEKKKNPFFIHSRLKFLNEYPLLMAFLKDNHYIRHENFKFLIELTTRKIKKKLKPQKNKYTFRT